MRSSALRQISLGTLCLVIAACGTGDGKAPSLPSAPQVAPVAGTSTPVVAIPVTSAGTKPDGFRAFFHVDPQPDAGGVIRGDTSLTVEFDLCRSQSDPDKPLSFLFDWDFDSIADLAGTGDACRQERTYKVRKSAGAQGAVPFETNVCVVSGNPRAHGPDTYWDCRRYQISVLAPATATAGAPGCGGVVGNTFVGSFEVNDGPNWQTNPPTFNCVEACALLFGGSSGDYACSTDSQTVNHLANLDGWGLPCHVDTECYKLNDFYDCGSGGCSESAYVSDHNCGQTNYCFR